MNKRALLSLTFIIILCIAGIAVFSSNQTSYDNMKEQSEIDNLQEAANTSTTENTTIPGRGFSGVLYEVPNMDNVEVVKNIEYKEDRISNLSLDIYYPSDKKPEDNNSPIVFVHGRAQGMSNLKDHDFYTSWARLVAASGHTAITFNWRSDFPDDVLDLLSYIRQNSNDLGIDPDNISVFMFSAGVHPTCRRISQEGMEYIDGIIAYYGKIPESILENYTPSNLPPIFIAEAANDAPSLHNNYFISKGLETGYDITHMVHSTADHAFDMHNDDDETKKIIEKTLEFIDKIKKNHI
ncbi:alpha/beta hydrolase [Alkaliphilus peptidifermentans]|uniref:Acetyl esterase/lipase n=1 Tax=Alkaliphilus peptidifermentans DSM 18978 TaxID=1120976 RepID=A0A1G5JTG1_9FIRM|nr:alpha/beta hydrolase [Alkaliphilus peptidifermentans]SCY91444.1 Acetyl esterase/lipase [Alkaliphilus peptidifermentans DSM 18978]